MKQGESLIKTVRMRPATLRDIPVLEYWDRQPHVIAATTDDPSDPLDMDWPDELAPREDGTEFFIAMLGRRAIGVMQIIDPERERTAYWGHVAKNLRALDIWIGEPDCLGRGYGRQMMHWAIRYCFDQPDVTGILIDPLFSNQEAIRFYKRLGFKAEARRQFDETSDCLVMRLNKDAVKPASPYGEAADSGTRQEQS